MWVPKSYILRTKMNPTIQKTVLEKFNTNQINVLIATSVVEEGIDIRICNIVIAYNAFMNLKSFIQMKGRARAEKSEFIVLSNEKKYTNAKGELENLNEIANIMKYLGTLSDPIKPNTEITKNFGCEEKDIIFIPETGAKIGRICAKEYIENYCQTLRNGDQYLKFWPKYKVFGSDPQKVGVLILPGFNGDELIQAKKYHGKNKDCENEAAFEYLKILVKIKKLDKYLYPINKRTQIKEKNKKVLKYLEENEKFKKYKKLQKHIEFNNIPIYKSKIFEPICFDKVKTLYFQPIVYKDFISNAKNQFIGILHFGKDGIKSLPFKISCKNYLNHLSELTEKVYNSAIENIEILLANNYEIVLNISEYQELKFFFMFMIFLMNNAISILIQAILNRKLQFGLMFDVEIAEFSKKSIKFEFYDQIFDKIIKLIPNDDNLFKLCVIPLIGNYKKYEIDWKTVKNTITFCKLKIKQICEPSLIKFDFTYENTGNIVLDSHTKIPRVLLGIDEKINGNSPFPDPKYVNYSDFYKQKYGMNIEPEKLRLYKVFTLPGQRESALFKSNHDKKENLKENTRILHFPSDFLENTGINASIYQYFIHVPTILAVLNEQHKFYEFANQNYTYYLQNAKISINDAYVKNLQIAFACSSAQLENNYERLELLGDAILKYFVSIYVFFSGIITYRKLYNKHDKMNEGELTIRKCKKVDNKGLMKRVIEYNLYENMRVNPIYARKDIIFEEYLNLFELAKKFSPCFEKLNSFTNELIFNKNTIEYAKFIEHQVSDLKNTCKQMLESYKFYGSSESLKISFKQLADIFESSLGALYISYGLEACKQFLIYYKTIKDTNSIKSGLSQNPIYTIPKFSEVEKDIIQYEFLNKSYLVCAFMHASKLGSLKFKCESYQRFEFLGDAILEFLVTRYLYEKYADAGPGLLTELKFCGLNNNLFAFISVTTRLFTCLQHESDNLTTDIQNYVLEIQSHHEICDLDAFEEKYVKILADIFEALVGAVFLDTNENIEKTAKTIMPILEPYLEKYASIEYCKNHRHPKTLLTEFLSNNKLEFRKTVKVSITQAKTNLYFIYECDLFEISVLIEQNLHSPNKTTRKLFWKKAYSKIIEIFNSYNEKHGSYDSTKHNDFIKFIKENYKQKLPDK